MKFSIVTFVARWLRLLLLCSADSGSLGSGCDFASLGGLASRGRYVSRSSLHRSVWARGGIESVGSAHRSTRRAQPVAGDCRGPVWSRLFRPTKPTGRPPGDGCGQRYRICPAVLVDDLSHAQSRSGLYAFAVVCRRPVGQLRDGTSRPMRQAAAATRRAPPGLRTLLASLGSGLRGAVRSGGRVRCAIASQSLPRFNLPQLSNSIRVVCFPGGQGTDTLAKQGV